MKGIAAVILIGLMSLAVLGITMDNSSVTTHKAEIEDTLSNSMRNTLKASNVEQMYEINDQAMSIELLRNISQNINTESDLDVYIYEATTQGLLDVELQTSFKHVNGETGVRDTRKVLYLEIVDNLDQSSADYE